MLLDAIELYAGCWAQVGLQNRLCGVRFLDGVVSGSSTSSADTLNAIEKGRKACMPRMQVVYCNIPLTSLALNGLVRENWACSDKGSTPRLHRVSQGSIPCGSMQCLYSTVESTRPWYG